MKPEVKYIHDHFGLEKQIAKAREEAQEYDAALAELQRLMAINAAPIDIATQRLNVIEEAADVKLTKEQIIYGLKGESDYKKMYQFKIQRTLDRIKTGHYDKEVK